MGRATGIVVGGASYVHSVAYHPNGLVQSGGFGNGQVFSQTLTDRQRPWVLTTARSGGPAVMQRSHAYEVRGKVASITDAFDPAANRGFAYDGKGRVSVINGSWGGSVVYDAPDNIRRQTLGGRVIDVSYVDGSNRVTSASDAGQLRPYGYDARGNAITAGPLGFSYDFANQPVSVWGATSASHVYDGNLKRVKTVSGGKTVYTVYSALGGSVMLRDEVTDGRATDYLSVGPLAVRLTNGANPEYIHSDHLGSPVAATNASGAISWRENYTPFGEARVRPVGNANQPGYTGHVQDAATGLTYMQARYHDPVIGRFLAKDPIGYQDQLNLYAYVRNDPVNMVDPDGRAGVGAFIGGALDLAVQMAEIGFGVRDGIDGRSLLVSAVSGSVGVGLAGKLGQVGGLVVDVAVSVGSTLAKGESVSVMGVAADVGMGKAGGALAKHAIQNSPAHKVAERQADRLERIGSKEGARPAQQERAANAGPALAKSVEQRAAQVGIVGSGIGSTAEKHIQRNLTEEKQK